ncbi:hypothetical protein BT63DRAFT_449343 [Microthyrium microscopicum]|uniref:Uncharacterized protein n=1 Tax=Microthyrium microscopicum TaxID=703497 RepID=A0A6A6USJ2_9PEZI|nr:hypothetical protein BT63DRAFT_449343 [Microthyrium microscopicum]
MRNLQLVAGLLLANEALAEPQWLTIFGVGIGPTTKRPSNPNRSSRRGGETHRGVKTRTITNTVYVTETKHHRGTGTRLPTQFTILSWMTPSQFPWPTMPSPSSGPQQTPPPWASETVAWPSETIPWTPLTQPSQPPWSRQEPLPTSQATQPPWTRQEPPPSNESTPPRWTQQESPSASPQNTAPIGSNPRPTPDAFTPIPDHDDGPLPPTATATATVIVTHTLQDPNATPDPDVIIPNLNPNSIFNNTPVVSTPSPTPTGIVESGAPSKPPAAPSKAPSLVDLLKSIPGLEKLSSMSPIVLNGLINTVLGAYTKKATSVEMVQPKIRQDAKRARIKYGPFTIKGAKSTSSASPNPLLSGLLGGLLGKTSFGTGNFKSMDPGGTSFIQVLDKDFPTEITMIYSKLDIIASDGQPIDIGKGLYAHHAVFASLSKIAQNPVLSCNGKPLNLTTLPTFIGAAGEAPENYFTDVTGKVNSGVHIPKDDKLIMQIDIVNYADQDQEIYLVPEIEYMEGFPPGFAESDRYTLSPGTCDPTRGPNSGQNIQPPEGQKKFEIAGPEMTFEENGHIMYSRAHLHDGGDRMDIEVNGKIFCSSKAEYGGEGRGGEGRGGEGRGGEEKSKGTLSGQSSCPPVLEIHKGDKMKLTAYYDLEQHPPRMLGGHSHGEKGMGGMMDSAEEMALFLIQFAPAKS